MPPDDNTSSNVFSDFLRRGVDRLRGQNFEYTDFFTLFSALENFQRDIRECESIPEILRTTHSYIWGLDFFHVAAFYMVDPETLSFDLTQIHPEKDREELDELVKAEILSGSFAWALRQSRAVFFKDRRGEHPSRGIFHSMGTRSNVVGMFCGILRDSSLKDQEIALSLLSILLVNSTYAIDAILLKNKILAYNKQLERSVEENKILARIPEESPSPVIRCNREGIILYTNDEAQVVLDALPDKTNGIVPCELLRHINIAFKELRNQEFEIEVGEHTYTFLLVPVAEAGYANFYGTDITTRKQFEKAMVLAKEEAQRADRAKSDFLAVMSHEIRTPLNSILGFADLLTTTSLDHEQKEFLQIVRTSGRNLLYLINDILDYSKIEAGKLEMEEEEFDFRSCVHEVIDILSVKASEKGLTLNLSVDSSVPSQVVGDSRRVQQVLLNLVGNAIKFTDEGRVDIFVHPSNPVDEEGRIELHLSVRDTGIGISSEKLGRLFQPFTQADSSITRQYGGTGLGLVISQRLCHLMGGKIWAESEPGKGAEFHFTVRVGEVDVPVGTTLGVGLEGEVKEAPSRAGTLRILVAEDNVHNQNLMKVMLGKFGHEVDLVENGKEAVQAFSEKGYDLVLMDIRMPEMDGLTATRLIREWETEQDVTPRSLIYALTADAQEGNRDHYLREGMDDYLAKPISLDGLKKAIDRAAEQLYPAGSRG